tara:strand:- start:66 stop:695 length:630 start_codon:yes stop_codon:yes gene_type:complete
MINDSKILTLGKHWSFNIINDPKRLAFVLARYSVPAKLASKGKSIIELGCSEGIGIPLLMEHAKSYIGVDMDTDAIKDAERNWKSDNIKFIEDDFLDKNYGKHDIVISLDVIEHIHPDKEDQFLRTICDNMKDNGIAVIGTPNITSSEYASPASQAAHINMYSGKRLVESMSKYFKNVFLFGINDEVIHNGFDPMTNYVIALGCGKKNG